MLCQHSSRINISQLEIIPNRDYGERQIANNQNIVGDLQHADVAGF